MLAAIDLILFSLATVGVYRITHKKSYDKLIRIYHKRYKH